MDQRSIYLWEKFGIDINIFIFAGVPQRGQKFESSLISALHFLHFKTKSPSHITK
nr:MAG TPA: hypothetical protein [Caudoviricetes sp.]